MTRLFAVAITLFLCMPYTPPIERVMMIGNSITYKTPEMEGLGWAGSHGVAATFPYRDWVHQTWAGIAAHQAKVPDMWIVSIKTPTIPPQVVDKIRGYQPDLIVIQWGEVMTPTASIEAWKAQYAPLAAAAQEVGARVIAVGIWANESEGDLRHVNQAEAINQVGMEYVRFDDIHTPVTEASGDGTCTNADICWHPDDGAMKMLAERILETIYPPQAAYLPFAANAQGGTVPP